MAYIIIDGYNLIGIAHNSLEKARNDIVEKLCQYSSLKEHDVTIVFDGWKDGQNVETKIHTGNVNIIYSRLGEKADFVIKKLISETTKSWIVVSSDREISSFANRKELVSLTSDEFESKLYSALYSVEEREIEDYGEDDDLMPVRQKGNPRKMSKKQKKKIRALEKL
jgi:predicted RNA-binding protein with PIN domain